MGYLAQRGFLVFGYDHLGHGQIARSDKELGYFAAKHGHRYLVEDVYAFYTQVSPQYPGHPFILFGHSMARLLSVWWHKYGQELDGLIICGTGGPNAMARRWDCPVKIIQTLRGKKHISNTLKTLAFPNLTSASTLMESWLDFPRPRYPCGLCRRSTLQLPFTASAMGDLVRLNRRCNQPACYDKTPAQLPSFSSPARTILSVGTARSQGGL